MSYIGAAVLTVTVFIAANFAVEWIGSKIYRSRFRDYDK